MDDAPWLLDRVDYGKIDMAHELLTSSSSSINGESLVEMLNFRRLSSVVKEVLRSGFSPQVSQPQQQNDLNRFNLVLKSVAFRNGIRQVIRHEREVSMSSMKRRGEGMLLPDNSKELSSAEILRRLFLLESVTVVGCSNIQVSYLVDGIDVTKYNNDINLSSDYLLVEESAIGGGEGMILYIDTSTGNARLWVNCVVMAIKHVKARNYI